MGAGAGSARVACGICIGERESGVTATLGVGRTFRSGRSMGVEATGWTVDDGGIRES